MFTYMDIYYLLSNNIGTILMIVVCTAVWKVLKINEAMKRERDLIEVNMIQQQKDYEMVLSRAMDENRRLRNDTRALLNDIQTERRKTAELHRMIESSQRESSQRQSRDREIRQRREASGNNSRTQREEPDFFNSLQNANTVLQTVATVGFIGFQIFKMFRRL